MKIMKWLLCLFTLCLVLNHLSHGFMPPEAMATRKAFGNARAKPTVAYAQTPKSTITSRATQPSPLQVFGVYGVLPTLPAVVLPMLTELYRSSQEPLALLSLLIAKRIFLYLLAIIGTAYAGWRASQGVINKGGGAGSALDALSREIIKAEQPSPPKEAETSKGGESFLKPPPNEKGEEQVFAALDDQENLGQSTALALPFLLTAGLSISYILTSMQGQQLVEQNPQTFFAGLNVDIDVKALFGMITSFTNAVICILFSATENRSCIAPALDKSSEENVIFKKIVNLPNLLGLASVAAASYLPLKQAWPFQNSINIAVAVTVTRAVTFFLVDKPTKFDKKGMETMVTSIRSVGLALTGLAIYDAASVWGTRFFLAPQSAGAVDLLLMSSSGTEAVSVIQDIYPSFTLGDSSVMETVARAQLSGPWKPGLIEMVLLGRISDALGLGDIVYPACLVAWGFVMGNGYATAAIGGYVLGSIGTELVSTFAPISLVGQGLPALIFITPAMLGSVSAVALWRGELQEIWSDNEEVNGVSSK